MATLLDDRALLKLIHPVGEVFYGNFDSLRPVQRETIRPIVSGRNVLVSASTAAGKTEAVMAPLIARVRRTVVATRRTRILVVTPTRALVNDMAKRLEPKLSLLGWNCGCQTSDRRDRESSPEVLITTPESFDSTLVAGFSYDSSRNPADHLLARVEAVFLDEGHCYASTVRGDQILFLLHRLRRLREWACKKGLCPTAEIQVCTASATLPNAAEVAQRLLGDGAATIQVAESRQIHLLASDGNWVDATSYADCESLHAILPNPASEAALVKLLLAQRTSHKLHKILVFVQSRSECDNLTTALRSEFGRVVDSWVGPHHSSLPSKDRKNAEQRFATESDAVLVCTSTMEVGVDIGDVDAVCLVGPPPGVASLLQRIGRGNRNTRDLTRVIAVARNGLEARVFGSQLKAAQHGLLKPVRFRRHWSVCVQQAFSFILQSHGEGRRAADIVAMAASAWPSPETNDFAEMLIKGLTLDGVLRERKSKLILSEEVASDIDERKGEFFANFDAASAGVAIYDGFTGELLANVAGVDPEAHTLNIGGRVYEVVDQDGGRLEVSRQRNPKETQERTSPRYASRRMPRLEEFCAHLRRGCGLQDPAAPLLKIQNRNIWFHFGGEVWERLLPHLFPTHIFGRSVIKGVAVECFCDVDAINHSRPDPARIRSAINQNWKSLLPFVEHGRFFRYLSGPVAQQAAIELLDADFLGEWVASREINLLETKSSQVSRTMASLLA